VENPFRDEQKRVKKRKKVAKSTLSFALDDEGGEDGKDNTPPSRANEDDEKTAKRPKTRKNPNVDTSFLPDREREELERKQREELRQEWLRKQEEMKKEEIEITYSYWDGSGHRKSVTVSSTP
jgi:protein FAM50